MNLEAAIQQYVSTVLPGIVGVVIVIAVVVVGYLMVRSGVGR